ncbi:hypothetical protein GCM10010502_52840 [Kitasatospora aureofaciens]|uniref:Uncharacterized protein n=1 Tax=Kitasatospora aureofaciens TaxID=1894 RepID=A0A8H9LPZ6_KITAU|nr:hypothetical protein GCM10010502_52840 [Kitasatospora aureofaciens]
MDAELPESAGTGPDRVVDAADRHREPDRRAHRQVVDLARLGAADLVDELAYVPG